MNQPIDISPELAQTIKQLCSLPVPIRLHIMEAIDQSLPYDLEFHHTPEQIAEMRRRSDDAKENPDDLLTWDEVLEQLKDQP